MCGIKAVLRLGRPVVDGDVMSLGLVAVDFKNVYLFPVAIEPKSRPEARAGRHLDTGLEKTVQVFPFGFYPS